MDKLNMQTPDMTDVNIEKIGQLFPNCITERIGDNGKVEKAIDFDQLRQELSKDIVEGSEERYQFTWPDKRNAIRLANTPSTMTLRPCREESIDFDNTENLYIEGDNLEVLKLLRENYLGKIKMIYIDPPYNTGNDFVYNDDFSQTSDEYKEQSGLFNEEGERMVKNLDSNGRFHTDWLNMIYPRLKVAKDLLTTDGVIFISIDDNEIDNLKKIASEIFGQKNFVAQLVWEKKKKGSFLSKMITSVKEYILVYTKEINSFQGLISDINRDTETYPCINAVNKREVRIIPPGIESKYKEKNYFLSKGSEISDTTMSLLLHSDLVIKNGHLAKELIIEGNWRYSQEAMSEYALKDELYITRDLYLRRIVKDTRFKTLKDLLPRIGNDTTLANNDDINYSQLSESGWGSNEDADEELRKLFGIQKLMDYPKPGRLISKLLASYRDMKDSIVLDFFSGSATTAQAIMELNIQDTAKRKFIMVQLPEATEENSEAFKAGYKNICEIGKERIRRAGIKIKEENKNKEGIENLDTGFRVLKLDSSNMNDVFYTPRETEQQLLFEDNIKVDRTPEDLLFQVMLECNIPLSAKIETEVISNKTVFNVNEGFLYACFDNNIDETVITEVAKRKPYYFIMRDKSMASDNVMDNFEQIFKAYSKDTIRKVL